MMESTGIEIRQSMEQLYDEFGFKMSVHHRRKGETIEVIINRSCKECTEFRTIPSGSEICIFCKYIKDWLELGKY